MRLLILGGDGFCGWPTSLHLSALGHDVAIVDNLSRRKIDNELECESLTPIRPMGERLRDLLKEWRPNAPPPRPQQDSVRVIVAGNLAVGCSRGDPFCVAKTTQNV